MSEYSFTLIHPSEGEYIEKESFFIIISAQPEISGGSGLSDLKDRMFLDIDGKYVGKDMDINETVIQYMPDNDQLSGDDIYGKHNISFVFIDSSGDTLTKKEWQVTVLHGEREERQSRNIRGESRGVQGRIYSRASHYFYDNREKFEFYQGASINGHLNKLRYGSRVLVNNLNHSCTQDRNRYYIWVNYGKKFRLRAGDTSPEYHPTLFNGVSLRGFEAGGSVITEDGGNPVNLDVAFGRARRRAEPDIYERNIVGSRLSFGSGRTFQLGVCLLKGRDDTSSLSHKTDTLIDSTLGSDTVCYVDKPGAADNLAFGVDFIANLFKNRLSIFGDYAFSLYTRNINDGPLKNEDVEEAFGNIPVDFEIFSKLFVYNLSSSPLHPSIDGLINSSAINLRLKIIQSFPILNESFKFKYTIQGANFHSMGNVFTGFPRRGFEINEEIRLFSNRLGVNAVYWRYSDDLDQSREFSTVTRKFLLNTSIVNISNIPAITLSYQYDGAVNEDSLYGFKNGMNMINAVCDLNYNIKRFSGIIRFYTGWSGINNQWNNLIFSDSASFSSQVTDMSFSTGIYGVNINTRHQKVPLSFGGGFSTNAGSGRMIRLYSGNGFFRYNIIKEILVINAGLHVGGVQMPGENKYNFYFRLPYGITYTRNNGHSVLLDGYTVERGGEWDAVNTLKYEWRF